MSGPPLSITVQAPQVALWSQEDGHLHTVGQHGEWSEWNRDNTAHQNDSSTDQQEISAPGAPSW